MEDEKELEKQLDKIERDLDKIETDMDKTAAALEKLSKCIDVKENTFCIKGIMVVSQDY